MKTAKIAVIVGLLTLTASIASIVTRDPGAERVGYFKSDGRDRVLAYVTPGPVTDDAAREILTAAPFTAGRVMAAHVYPAGTPAPAAALTAAPDLPAALRIVGEDFPGWSHRLLRNPAGQVTFAAR